MKTVAQQIAEKRSSLHMSFTDMAELLDVSSQLLGMYERGERKPKTDFYLKWKDVFKEDLLETKVSKLRYLESLRDKKNSDNAVGIPIYDVPIDAGFIERVRDNYYEPLYYLDIPRLKNCNFGAIVSGNSMYPLMKSGTIAICRIVDQFDYFDPGEMYFISTSNDFETVKYVQMAANEDELLLVPHNEKITPRTIRKDMIIRMCIVEAWLNFR